MNEQNFRNALQECVPDVPPRFHAAVTNALDEIVREEARPVRTFRGRRALALALVIALLLGTAAYAVYRFTTFDVLSFLTGENPLHADKVMSADLHRETVNGVEIAIREAGYDGRILFIQYSYRLPEAERMFDPYEDEHLFTERGVGWWTDNFWIDGVNMDMFGGSGSDMTVGSELGEIVHTQYWRLDEGDVQLTGEVEIALPIGAKPDTSRYFPRKDHPEWYNEDGSMKKPDQGLVSFRLDTRGMLDEVTVEHPEHVTVNELGSFRVSEAAYSPLMTYITLAMEGDPDALAAYKAEHGEGFHDEEGALLWAYGPMDVFGGWLCDLHLVDGEGQELFPGHFGNSGYGNEWAEFLYPHIADMPDTLWLAPIVDGKAQLQEGIRVR